jgi:hypothetical protein
MHTKGVFLVGFLVKLNYTKLTPFILLYSNIYLNFHPTFFSLRAKFRLDLLICAKFQLGRDVLRIKRIRPLRGLRRAVLRLSWGHAAVLAASL